MSDLRVKILHFLTELISYFDEMSRKVVWMAVGNIMGRSLEWNKSLFLELHIDKTTCRPL